MEQNEDLRVVILIMIVVPLILYGGDTEGLIVYFLFPLLFLGVVFGIPLCMIWCYDKRAQI